MDKGRLNYDVRHNWVTSYVWELPFGKHSHPFARQALQGWNWTGIFTLRSGFPFTVSSGRDNSLTSIGRDTADIVGSPALPDGRSRNAQILQWFNTTAFTFNAIGTYGTAALNIMDGPGFYNLDTGILKSFPITESKRLQFRFEAFNILNHANLSNPDGNVSSPNFGRITGTSAARILELGVKFQF